MLDSNYLRHNLEVVAASLKNRGFHLDTEKLSTLEIRRKALQTELQELQNQRNKLSKAIGLAKSKQEDVQSFLEEATQVTNALQGREQEFSELQKTLQDMLLTLPNVPHESVPIGNSEEDNQEICRWGTPPTFGFEPKDHVDLGERLGLLDFDAAAKITGARFVVMRDDLVRLHRALIQFMLDVHTEENGYREIYVPYLVNSESLYGTGQLPNLAGDQFKLEGEQNFYLIPTAEVPVTNLARDKIFHAEDLPVRFVCHTPCFRSEAGSYGKDTRGMIRQHQFEKVELVCFVKPEDSYPMLEQLTAHAASILQKLELPYRVMALCTADLGFSSAKTYDLEVWLPGQNRYREISSCSNFESFQARRLSARWRNPETGKPELLHTLNGSGLAIGRTLVAILENYQDAEGRIKIPKALQSYMRGQEHIG